MGAMWSIDGKAWHESGTTISDLKPAAYTIKCKSILGWNPPADTHVTLAKGDQKSQTLHYTSHVLDTTDNVEADSDGADRLTEMNFREMMMQDPISGQIRNFVVLSSGPGSITGLSPIPRPGNLLADTNLTRRQRNSNSRDHFFTNTEYPTPTSSTQNT